jgi:segregation and condensation protein A
MNARVVESTAGRIGVFPRPEATPEVVFADGLAEKTTHVRIEEFDGPLALLLALIEARQLDVLTVPLGTLAEVYLDALATLQGDRLGNVSSFVAVAAQLILIKSRAILPRPPKVAAVPLDDELDPEAELRARLLEYRRFRDAGARLGAMLGLRQLFTRDADAAALAGRTGAMPPERPPLPPSALSLALTRMAAVAPPPEMPPEIVARTITLSERTAVIRAALQHADAVVLQDLLEGVRDRVVVAVTFLAMLELSKRREITVEQSEPWGPIIARRLMPAEGKQVVEEAEIDESLESFA